MLPATTPNTLLDLLDYVMPWLDGYDRIVLSGVCIASLAQLGGPAEATTLRGDFLSFRELELERQADINDSTAAEFGTSDSVPSSPRNWHEGFWIDSDGHWHDESEDDW